MLLQCQADIFLSIETPNALDPFRLTVLQIEAGEKSGYGAED